ncbi:MAG: msrA3 [Gammaproteobacteria bacterium]|jgi:peptide methionine sulfoxide reductase msrA/msrB|nr:msrA3 [Gammaproteobacteria bacterium]
MTILKTQSLPPNTFRIVCHKATERPFTGAYDEFTAKGSYLCRQCGLALFRSRDKFHSGCGWPSFDEEITEAVKRVSDTDGVRIEILCARCDAHLGHVFQGEGYTNKNTRHCVNSLSLDFVSDTVVLDSEEAIVAGGCFWGVEYYLKRIPGVLSAEVGYTGGIKNNPSYEQVCSGNINHVEAVRVLYDPEKITYENLIHDFFKIHDPTQIDGQGPDIGSQYRSAIFYYNEAQQNAAEKAIAIFEKTGKKVRTQILPVSTFWPAEEYHQNYYEKTGKLPYCHRPA